MRLAIVSGNGGELMRETTTSMPPPATKRKTTRTNTSAAAWPPLLPRRRVALVVCLAWALVTCLHGGVGGSGVSLADAAPVRRQGVASSGAYVVGSRPVPSAARSSWSPSAARFADDKRRIPSCPDALHNR
ncbi:hypothetical protein GUJ93_ZPchr0001g29895 [Zizania palustris]|uniref:Uncharacterized protein n=1 Tax=Zizania palustris TaxID=103762 RepID=A0A8J5RNV5_ZIZPA|nr:hypothetical protein GUJ93_ZPchr0001g29895 [Zizania palustris]